ncbi:related to NUDIX family hydrolase [Lecanosticta acicola]|uniref:Related to NUDIX family hydrolase n=1 Tax=Lecanosticta acicola TaxID=111012 RepID=A0AAI8Z2N3_9PEZI|nr:related to NUDIX family hydrolase [Lecanosticta acicola]
MSISPSTRTHILNLKHLLRLPASIRGFATSPHLETYKIAADLQAENEGLARKTSGQGERKMSGSNLDYSGQKKRAPAIPRPSSSVILISPQNQILLLQRVKQSSSFPSAHVFPGGNVSEFHDGRAPDPEHADRHVDGEVYRNAAIRETFEESGILLARNNGFGRLIELPEQEREQGRRQVHGNEVSFPQWLAQKGGRADVDGLTPFTRWVTPTNVPKRFTTQMYLYFLPTLSSTPMSEGLQADGEEEVEIPLPTTDGGKEHTTARFLPASAWCRLAQEGRIILFPPQFFLLHQIAQHFDDLTSPTDYGSISRTPQSREELERRRKKLVEFVKSGTPPWTEKCISPSVLPPRNGKKREDGRNVLGLNRPGPELETSGAKRAGVSEECVLVDFKKEGPRRLAVISREEALAGGVKL